MIDERIISATNGVNTLPARSGGVDARSPALGLLLLIGGCRA
ncbi:MAG: hypothetical protein NXH91_14555 [Phyllobacteriaceae bacterium]|jgi:hypothetical protein|nr:hypothetical protein [Phyllobacteriaceae bacterium]